jgi:hypothetical protein
MQRMRGCIQSSHLRLSSNEDGLDPEFNGAQYRSHLSGWYVYLPYTTTLFPANLQYRLNVQHAKSLLNSLKQLLTVKWQERHVVTF